MRIAFLGDTHRNKYAIELALKKINEIAADMVIHLGDCIDDIEIIKEGFNGEVLGVVGNCDCTSRYPNNQIIDINNKKIFFTHGHLYGVKNSLSSILYKGEEVGADVILYGHTHITLSEDINGITIMNPGSIAKPSPWSLVGSIGFLEINDDGDIVNRELYKIPME